MRLGLRLSYEGTKRRALQQNDSTVPTYSAHNDNTMQTGYMYLVHVTAEHFMSIEMQGPHRQRPGVAAAACARAKHVLHALADAVKDAEVVIAAADTPQLLHHHLQGAQWLGDQLDALHLVAHDAIEK